MFIAITLLRIYPSPIHFLHELEDYVTWPMFKSATPQGNQLSNFNETIRINCYCIVTLFELFVRYAHRYLFLQFLTPVYD